MKNELRIIFMGTPEFAVASLQVLVETGSNVVGVITAPDKPKGRGKKLGTTPVKDYALSQNLNILQPTNLKNPDFVHGLKTLQADLQIVVAFRMLPEIVWNMPRLGTLNLHASLLPAYRGAAPINWAIINGEKETGVTTFFLKHEIDTGNIIFQEKEPILETDDAGSLYERLMVKGANLVLKTVKAIESDEFPSLDQGEVVSTKNAPKIFRQDCQVNWDRTSEEVHNFIRGLSPYPAAWTLLNDRTVKLYRSKPFTGQNEQETGQWESDNKTYIHFATNDGYVEILELQMEGKKRMKVDEFLRGQSI